MAAKEPPKAPPPARSGDRQARLAEALRENLKRRKSQARDRRHGDPKEASSSS